MNTQPNSQPVSPTIAGRPAQSAPVLLRRNYPERDFGTGYGRSSGYATTRQYARAWNGQPRFRCV